MVDLGGMFDYYSSIMGAFKGQGGTASLHTPNSVAKTQGHGEDEEDEGLGERLGGEGGGVNREYRATTRPSLVVV